MSDQNHILGTWEVPAIDDSHVTAIHANLLKDNKVLIHHARYPGFDAKFTSSIFDPSDNSIVDKIIPVWINDAEGVQPSALFCCGNSHLTDGNIFVAGGERARPPASFRGIKYSFLFDGTSWIQKTKMNKGRWYPQLTRLADGKIVAMSGYKYESETLEDMPEYYNPQDNTAKYIVSPAKYIASRAK